MKTVLIVDPGYAISGIGSMISTQGFLALVIPEARTALSTVRNGIPVDLIITELLLPDMEGMEFLQAIRKSAPELPVVVVTSDRSIESYLRAMSLSIFDYLHKPVRSAELYRSAQYATNPAGPGSLSFQSVPDR